MTKLGDDLLWLYDQLFAEAGISVDVTRGNTTVTMDAIKGRMITERVGDENVYGAVLPSDFIFRTSDYIAGVGGLPELNDRLEWTDDGTVTRRSQVAVDDRERWFDEVGQFGQMIRVHSVEI